LLLSQQTEARCNMPCTVQPLQKCCPVISCDTVRSSLLRSLYFPLLPVVPVATLNHSSAFVLCFMLQCSEADDCFLGSSVIDWLLKWHFAESRDGACRLAAKLMCQAHIQPVLPGRDKKTVEVTTSASKSFYDSSDVCYRFVSISHVVFLYMIECVINPLRLSYAI